MIRSSRVCSASVSPTRTWSPTSLGLPWLAATLLFGSNTTIAADSDASSWQRYENGAFIAYSNADSADALELLEEFETIRAAALRIPRFFVPDGRPKTLLLLPRTVNEFEPFAPVDSMAAFAQQLESGSAVVMPVSRRGTDSRSVVRHEFAHTMLFNDWFEYPQWYAEGFAELVAAIDINERRKTVTIGERPARYDRRIRSEIDWDTLIDERFNAHALSNARQIRAAYAQSWILFHYLTLNEETNYAAALDRYFSGVNNGKASPAAFVEAFGQSAEALWDSDIKSYARRPPSVSLDFDASSLDRSFVARPATPAELDPIRRFFRDKADARRPADNVASLALLPGRWDQLKLDGQCAEPLEFDVGDNLVTIDGYYNAADRAIPALFTVQNRDDGAFELADVTEASSRLRRTEFRLSIRNENVLCFDRMPVDRQCGTIFHRCDDRRD